MHPSSNILLSAFLVISAVQTEIGFSQQQSSTTVSATPTSITVGQSVDMFATIAPGSVVAFVPTGTVSFFDGSTVLGPNISLSPQYLTKPDAATFSQLIGNLDGSSQGQVLWTDLNGDGQPDILSYQNSFQVFLNSGQGQFNSLTSQNYKLQSPAIIDFNGDGKLDILSLSNTGTVQVLYGNGTGTFQAPIAAASIVSPKGQPLTSITVANLSGSNTPWILLGDASPSSGIAGDPNYQPIAVLVTIYKNNGAGDFGFAGSIQVGAPGAGRSPVINSIGLSDFNNDGKADIFTTWNTGGGLGSYSAITILLNNGSNIFSPTATYIGTYCSSGPCGISVAVADFGKRGRNDIALLSGGTGINLYQGNGDGTFLPALNIPEQADRLNYSLNSSGIGLVTIDLNGDGYPDLFDGYGFAYLNQGNFSFTPTTNLKTAAGQSAISGDPLVIGDFNGDGLADLLFETGPPIALLGSNKATAAMPAISNLSLGTHSITAQYSGDTHFASSTSIPVNIAVNAPPKTVTTTTLTASPNPSAAGQTITFRAVVSGTGLSTVPTGTVSFLNGSSQLGTASIDSTGMAIFTTSFPAIGNQTISANYLGDNGNLPSSGSVVEAIVSPFDLQAAASGATMSIKRGSSGNTTLTITPQNGFSGTVVFSCSGLPAGASCAFSPTSAALSGSATSSVSLTVTVPSTVSFNSADGLSSRIIAASTLIGALLFFFPSCRQLRNYRSLLLLSAGLWVAATFGFSGCGGSSTTTSQPINSSFNVIANSGAVQKAVSYSLTIN